jgi:hypothetical protein
MSELRGSPSSVPCRIARKTLLPIDCRYSTRIPPAKHDYIPIIFPVYYYYILRLYITILDYYYIFLLYITITILLSRLPCHHYYITITITILLLLYYYDDITITITLSLLLYYYSYITITTLPLLDHYYYITSADPALHLATHSHHSHSRQDRNCNESRNQHFRRMAREV